MKIFFYTLTIAGIFAACNNHQASQTSDVVAVSSDSSGTSYSVDPASSVLNWEGSAVYGSHNGTINVKNGTVTVNNGTITAGSFIIDMPSIKNIDITDLKKNSDLVGHLTSEDFFDTKKFPEGKFEISSVESLKNDSAGNTHRVSGNLTLKDITKNVSFPVKVNLSADELTADGIIILDRLQWNITYRSIQANLSMKAKLKDIAINDQLKVSIKLSAKNG
jgi:polyisoprenoid-binding protein YceI